MTWKRSYVHHKYHIRVISDLRPTSKSTPLVSKNNLQQTTFNLYRTVMTRPAAKAMFYKVRQAIQRDRKTFSGRRIMRSRHARLSNRVPPDMQDIVAKDGKTFHVSGCPFIHAKTGLRTIPALKAEREG